MKSDLQRVDFIINGIEKSVFIHPKDTLSKVIRENLFLTGTHIGCEQGSCGACTVFLNNKIVLSCITPAFKAQGGKIITIEGIASKGEQHLIQRAFEETGAVQCGFCTPGMIITALEFVQKNPNPCRDSVKLAISGNLCRCTGYQKIVDAIMLYAELKKGRHKEFSIDKTFYKTGNSIPYIETRSKTNGSAQYADDIRVSNSLVCKFLRSPHAHAKILKIDTSKAEIMHGVSAIITGKELPGKFGVLPISKDETAMAVEKTRYIGEIVAAVVAETEDQAQTAIDAIVVDYHQLKSFLNIESSLEKVGEQEKIHGHVKTPDNIHKTAELRFGDQDQGLKNVKHVLTQSFNFSGINHCFTEPHAATACWNENGLTLITATQVPHYLHRALAHTLEVPMNRIRVIKPTVGGGFGGKSDPFPHEIIISHLSRKTGRPVRCRLNREEVFLTNHGRHPSSMTVSMGMSEKGKLEVLDADIKIDGGAYGSFGVVTSYYNGVLLQAPYDISNFGFITRRVYTNKPQSGAMRGHGAVNSRFAVEVLIDQLAEKINEDPAEIRYRNFLSSNTLTVGQYRITSNGSRLCLKQVCDQSKWKDKFQKLPFGKGVGVACGFFISGSALPIYRTEYPQSVVHLKVDMDGRVLITSGASDIGQGSDTMLALIVGEVLGLSSDFIQVVAADTLLTPIDLGSYSSRVTFMAGNAAKMAAENLKQALVDKLNAKFNTSEGNWFFEQEMVSHSLISDQLSWNEVIQIATAKVGSLTVSGYYNSPKLGGDFKGAGAGLSPSYSFGALVAEVEVDPDTGIVQVHNVWGAHDVGKAINPIAVEGQLEGSWHMGMGQALMEEMRYHEGLLVNANLLNYKVPTSLDTPDFSTNIIETIDPEGPFGAKECGEGALHPVIPAIANAIYDAVGVRINSLPITPEVVKNALMSKEELV